METQPTDKMTLDLKFGSKRESAVEMTSVAKRPTKKRVKSLPVTEEFMDLLHQVKQIGEIKAITHRTTTTWKDWVLYQWNDGFLQPLSIWLLWLFVGTMYFTNVDFDGNYAKGFYFSISVGYCLGWGVLSPKYRYSKVFAIFYLFVGALFVLHYVTVLIQLAVAEDANTYEQLKVKKNIERTCKLKGWQKTLYVYLAMNNEKLFIIYVWVLYVIVGASVTVAVVRWSWLNGFYFSITTLATAGLFGIPHDSPDYLFLLTALFTCTGVPTMAMAVSNIGMLIMEARAEARVEAIINQEVQVTRDEVVDILKLKEHNSKIFSRNKVRNGGDNTAATPTTTTSPDGSGSASPTSDETSEEIVIDRNEFLIVSLIRMKTIDIELIHDLLTKFDRVDAGGDGQLTLQMVKSSSRGSTSYSSSNAVDQPYIVREFSKGSEVAVGSANGNDKTVADKSTVSVGGTATGASESEGDVSGGGGRINKDGYQYLEDV